MYSHENMIQPSHKGHPNGYFTAQQFNHNSTDSTRGNFQKICEQIWRRLRVHSPRRFFGGNLGGNKHLVWFINICKKNWTFPGKNHEPGINVQHQDVICFIFLSFSDPPKKKKNRAMILPTKHCTILRTNPSSVLTPIWVAFNKVCHIYI